MHRYYPEKRYRCTLEFLKRPVIPIESNLDLGVANPLTEIMKENGYEATNTLDEDLDLEFQELNNKSSQVITTFEIPVHLVSSFQVLQAAPENKLLASVPLKLWFAQAYQSITDKWDGQYHTFQTRQFDWPLKKAGWDIKNRMMWNHPVRKIGIRTLLRLFTPSYYLVYAERMT
jgi:hypothetical protein